MTACETTTLPGNDYGDLSGHNKSNGQVKSPQFLKEPDVNDQYTLILGNGNTSVARVHH